MKTMLNFSKIFKIIAAVLIVAGIFSFGFYSGGLLAPATPIKASEAFELHNNYMKRTKPIEEVTKGIYLSRQTIDDVVQMSKYQRTADGVRLYFGLDADGGQANVIVGVRRENKDDTEYILKSSGIASPCPMMCDSESPITKR